ncbi:MAG: hypothetical protein JSV86_12820 [Gemmatimonadota bacterium]|nr:MAG: hypothetical protein JSV86_12820 [Gemmatimonadota bacterium]
MAGTWPTPDGLPLGLQPDVEKVRVINRSAATRAVGDVVMFDLEATDGDVSTFRPGDENSIFANVILPATAGLRNGWFAIVTEGGADNAEMTVAIRGVVKANVSGLNAAALTDELAAVNGQDTLDSDAVAAGERVIGRPLETTAGGTEEQIYVLFNGIEGIAPGTGT